MSTFGNEPRGGAGEAGASKLTALMESGTSVKGRGGEPGSRTDVDGFDDDEEEEDVVSCEVSTPSLPM